MLWQMYFNGCYLCPEEDGVGGSAALDGEALPLVRTRRVVLHVVERLGSLVHHQSDAVGQPGAVAVCVPGGVDHVYLGLDLGSSYTA